MEEGPPRKLAVLLHADVVGSTALVQLNETLAHERIRDAFKRFSEIIASHDGTAHEIRGDALLAEFSKASDAVGAALAFQSANTAHNEGLRDEVLPVIRVGIAMGEVLIADDTVTGEAVVLAQRLEQLADPGGVCIHGTAQDTVPKRLPFEYESLGERELKGFDEPVRAFRVVLPGNEIQSEVSAEETSSSPSSDTCSGARTSLAVLPFSTVGHVGDTEEIADGITDVLINTLSRTGMSEIADRASTFSYKGQTPRPADVSEALGVQHVLQGTVQQSGSRVRITAELFDAEANGHVWSERFDRSAEDVFELQDDIAKRITQSIRMVVVYSADWDVPTDSFDAWLLNIQGVEHYNKGSAEDNHRARKLFKEVAQLDPQYAYGPCNLSWTHIFDCLYAWSDSPEKSAVDAIKFARQMYEVDQLDVFPFKEGTLGVAMYLNGNHDQALELADKSLARNPDEPCSMGWSTGWIHCLSGNAHYALAILERSNRLFNNPPWNIPEYLGLCYLVSGRPQEAIPIFERARSLAVDGAFAQALKAAAYMELSKPERGESEMRRALNERPGLSLRDFHYYLAFRDAAQRERFSQALVQAGLPE